jgi:hypothetical protein
LARYQPHTDKVIVNLKKERMVLDEKCSKEVDDKIHLCSRATTDGYCNVYAFPHVAWRRGDCPMADEKICESYVPQINQKIRVGQQKQKKRK